VAQPSLRPTNDRLWSPFQLDGVDLLSCYALTAIDLSSAYPSDDRGSRGARPPSTCPRALPQPAVLPAKRGISGRSRPPRRRSRPGCAAKADPHNRGDASKSRARPTEAPCRPRPGRIRLTLHRFRIHSSARRAVATGILVADELASPTAGRVLLSRPRRSQPRPRADGTLRWRQGDGRRARGRLRRAGIAFLKSDVAPCLLLTIPTATKRVPGRSSC
jgi:hypothetical protein